MTSDHEVAGSIPGTSTNFKCDTVITKLPTTVGGRNFALGWLFPGTNCAENRERCLHIVAQETINSNVTLVHLNLMRIPILKAIFG